MENNLSIPAMAWIGLATVSEILVITGLNAGLKRTGWDNSRRQKILIGAIATMTSWTALLLGLAYNGFFSDFSKLPPRPALAVLVPLPFILLYAFSKQGSQLIKSVPSHWLVLMQSFRIAVEFLLLSAFIAGKMPVQMTFEGRNFDILTGILALPAGYLIATKKPYSRKLAVAFNIAGLLLLLNVLVIAVLSMPTPIRYFMNEPANSLVGQFPFILLPGILVPLAYGLHILSLRQLWLNKRDADA